MPQFAPPQSHMSGYAPVASCMKFALRSATSGARCFSPRSSSHTSAQIVLSSLLIELHTVRTAESGTLHSPMYAFSRRRRFTCAASRRNERMNAWMLDMDGVRTCARSRGTRNKYAKAKRNGAGGGLLEHMHTFWSRSRRVRARAWALLNHRQALGVGQHRVVHSYWPAMCRSCNYSQTYVKPVF